MATSTLVALPKKEAELRAAFWDQMATFPDGYKIRNCIQCGSCTGSCPAAYAMDITPREIVALFRAGFLEDILRSRAIWICASCYACTVRCPAGIRVTDNLYALKRLATQKGIFPKRFPAHALSRGVRRQHSQIRAQLGALARLQVLPRRAPRHVAVPRPPAIRAAHDEAPPPGLEADPHPTHAGSPGHHREGAGDGRPLMEYAYYPGCSLEATGRPYDTSLRRVFHRLEIGLNEIEDWNCCGATSYISMNKLTAYALTARNLAYAERMGMNVCAPCSSCFTILSKVNRHVRWDAAHRNEINEVLSAAGLQYSGTLEVLHPLGILVGDYGIEKIVSRAVRRFDHLRIAPYYGCQLVRPLGRFDDREDPRQLDDLFQALGADVVPFPAKVRCCGGMLMTTYEDVALKLNREILQAAVGNGADVLITTCPMCQINLEAYQERINEVYGTAYNLPIVYFTQILGLALGFSPRRCCWTGWWWTRRAFGRS